VTRRSSRSPTRDGAAELEEIDRVFAALAHPARRHILLVLHARGDRVSSKEIDDRFSHSWPTTRGHLRKLEQANLIAIEAAGRNRFYTLNLRKLDDVAGGWLRHFG
jgi:DNA-binding transcriptional ArsR family regulator